MRRPRHLGRRGASLLIYGAIWLLAGLPLLFADPPSEWHIVALRAWASLFVFAGLTAMGSAFRRTPRSDRVGFIALSVTAALWIVYCLVMLGISATTNVAVTAPPVYLASTAVSNILLLVKINIDAGWSEPTPTLKD